MAANGSRLGGVHLELTGEDVTECTGGARDLVRGGSQARLQVDAWTRRLNYEQSLELAMLIVRKHQQVNNPDFSCRFDICTFAGADVRCSVRRTSGARLCCGFPAQHRSQPDHVITLSFPDRDTQYVDVTLPRFRQAENRAGVGYA